MQLNIWTECCASLDKTGYKKAPSPASISFRFPPKDKLLSLYLKRCLPGAWRPVLSICSGPAPGGSGYRRGQGPPPGPLTPPPFQFLGPVGRVLMVAPGKVCLVGTPNPLALAFGGAILRVLLAGGEEAAALRTGDGPLQALKVGVKGAEAPPVSLGPQLLQHPVGPPPLPHHILDDAGERGYANAAGNKDKAFLVVFHSENSKRSLHYYFFALF